MKYCWSYSNNKSNSEIQVGIGLLCVCLFLCFCNPKFWNPITISVGLLVIPIPAMAVSVSSRKYCIDENGLILSYPFGRVKVFCWSDISEVGICKVHYAARSDAHKVAIRCAIGIEEEGPSHAKTARESWQSLAYEVIHHKSVVSIYYTDERLAEFEKVCPVPIKDYTYLKER